ncbi:MAG: hypothetical protein Nkreftii_001812 [Candidatus Nitrospira kreftii]|uniref:Uncharacterized protein n=1 Tax=Candidatus Nitrospira kreftii TaxID=2652173 RepID=A0A7S8IZ88_9BACT|nr:MAG: hypothetical protein Nkreftii_001812 [Candidatus Nitrospira kreftii]
MDSQTFADNIRILYELGATETYGLLSTEYNHLEDVMGKSPSDG